MSTPNLRICLFSFYFAPLIGGAEAVADRQARLLRAAGHDVTVVTLRVDRSWQRREILDGLPIVRVGGLYKPGGRLLPGDRGHVFSNVALFWTLWRMRRRFDVIHCFQVSPLIAGLLAVGRLARIPVILRIASAGASEAQRERILRHPSLMADTLTDTAFLEVDPKQCLPGDMVHVFRSAIGGRAIYRAMRRSRATFHVGSSRLKRYLLDHGFPEAQIAVLPVGVDTDTFRPAPALRPDPAQPERAVLCVARLAYAKGVDVLLHAWARMLREPGDWRAHLVPRLRIAGGGKLRPQLERIAAGLGIQDSVEFLGARRDVVDLLQGAWGYVQPSRWEGLPGALLEAMACGLPCVATRVSGAEDAIVDGRNGLLVEPESPAELAAALRRLVADADLGRAMGEAARATILRDYRLAQAADRLAELYRGAVAGSRPER